MAPTRIVGVNLLALYDDEQLQRFIRAGMPVLAEASVEELTEYTNAVEARVAEKRFGTSTGPRQLRNRGGHLRSSLYAEAIGNHLRNIEGAVGATAKYAARHEKGSPGGQRPPGARTAHAAIPLRAAMTPSGVPRIKPREVPHSYFIRSKRGQLLLMGDVGGVSTPMFLLVRWENIGPTPPRLGIEDTMNKGMPRFLKKYQARLTSELQRLAGGK